MNKYKIIQIIAGCVFLAAFGYLVYTNLQYSEAQNSYSELLQYAPQHTLQYTAEESNNTDKTDNNADEPLLDVNHSELKAINSDYCFWLSACGNNISYPVVRGADNSEYLHKTFNKKRNFAGCIFMDYRCKNDLSDFHTVLYGHSMKDWSMFRSLIQYTDAAFAQKYPSFYIYTEDGRVKYNIFSVYMADENGVLFAATDSNDEEKAAFINTVKQKTMYSLDVDASEQDSIVSLVTCDVRDESKRVVVNAVRVIE